MELKLGPLGLRFGKVKTTFGQLQQTRVVRTALGLGEEWAKPVYGNYITKSVPAYRAIKLRADAVASAPLKVYRRRSNAAPEPVGDEHPVQSLLDTVNRWWTAADLWKATETYLSLWGSAYWFLEKEGNQVTGIWPLRPDRMRIIPDIATGPNKYIAGFLYEDVQHISLLPDQIVWFRYFNPMDEYAGLSPLAAARLTLDMGTDAVRFNREFFRNGAMPQDLIFTANGPVTEEEIEEFYKRLDKRHSGATKAHRPMIVDLSQGGKPERLGLTQRDMEFMAALEFTVEDAARVWGVPPPKMYSQKSSIYNNVKQADVEFYTDTIANEWAFLASEVNELLLPLMGDPTLYVAFDTSNVLPLQEAIADQHAREREDVKMGIVTINEVRQRRNLEPLPWGDTFWIPFNLVAAGTDQGQQMAQTIGGKPQTAFGKMAIEEMYNRELAVFDKRLTFGVGRFQAMQDALFTEQRGAVLHQLHTKKSARDIGGDLLNQEQWKIIFTNKGRPIIAGIFRVAAEGQGDDFGLGPFNPDLARVQQWIQDRTEFWAERVNLETAQLLMEELAEGNALGESIPALAERVEKVFKFNNAVRAERIARTESLAAANAGNLEIYRQSGVVEKKIWLATLDERTRPPHAKAHRQIVAAESPFLVDGEELEAPGIGGSPGNTINCRCAVAPIIERASLRQANGNGIQLAKLQ